MFARTLALSALAASVALVSVPARASEEVTPRGLAVMISSVALFVKQNCPGLEVSGPVYRRVTDQLGFDPSTMSQREAGQVVRTVQVFAAQSDSCAVVYREAEDGPMNGMIIKRR